MLTPENRFDVCQFCGKKFEREETLAVHVMGEHDSLIGSGDDDEDWK
ncbi:MAG TPA: hypothetical protein VKA40_11205 [Nitrososphaera sp.]|nr:hypothetical protein [Nitrososphaera sp.]